MGTGPPLAARLTELLCSVLQKKITRKCKCRLSICTESKHPDESPGSRELSRRAALADVPAPLPRQSSNKPPLFR